MSDQEIQDIIKRHPYHFFVCASPTSIPIPFAIHTWILIVNNGSIERREVLYKKKQCKTSRDYLHLNAIRISAGLTMFFWGKKRRYKARILYHIGGESGSHAEEVVRIARQSVMSYPFKSVYHLPPGPNSNTFTQRILNHLPTISYKLPWNAFGKGYKYK